MSSYDHNTLVEWLSQNSTNFDASKLTYDNKLSHDNVREYTSFYTYHGTLELTSVKDFPTHILLFSSGIIINDNFDTIEVVIWPTNFSSMNFTIESEKIKKLQFIQSNLITNEGFLLSLNTPNLKNIESDTNTLISHLFLKGSNYDITLKNITFTNIKPFTKRYTKFGGVVHLKGLESVRLNNFQTVSDYNLMLHLIDYNGTDLDFVNQISNTAKLDLFVCKNTRKNKVAMDKLRSIIGNIPLMGINYLENPDTQYANNIILDKNPTLEELISSEDPEIVEFTRKYLGYN